ncbi:hypothetical protein DASC09_019480 [Saccharomycopsis crataegensis]|uniref:Uncharacterized protein n=1 Tax=Saccharomycopsis crataegensis TaxID=43959 RepID=A0AAV5QIF5_9ASCO|nr:hypothetical protein DASC09_019480 [Saccharomycopsis crataegensis]
MADTQEHQSHFRNKRSIDLLEQSDTSDFEYNTEEENLNYERQNNARYQRLIDQLEKCENHNFDYHEVDEDFSFEKMRQLIETMQRQPQYHRYWYRAVLSLPVYKWIYDWNYDGTIPANEFTAKFVEATGFDIASRSMSFEPNLEIHYFDLEGKMNSLENSLKRKINNYERCLSGISPSQYVPSSSRDKVSNSENLRECVLNDICCVLRLRFPALSVECRSTDFVFKGGPNSKPVFPIKMASSDISAVHWLASYGFVGIKESPTDISFSIMRQLLRLAMTYKSDLVGLSDFEHLLIIKFLPYSRDGVVSYDYKLFDLNSTPINIKWAITVMVYYEVALSDDERKEKERRMEELHDSLALSKDELKKIGNQQIPKIEKDQRPRPATSAWESTNIVCTPDYLSILEAGKGKVFCMKKVEFIDCIDANRFHISNDTDEITLRFVDMHELRRSYSLDERGNFSMPFFHKVKKEAIDQFYGEIECYERIEAYNKLHPGSDERVHCPRFLTYGCGVIATRWEFVSGLFFATERLKGKKAATPGEFAKGIKEIEKLASIGIKFSYLGTEMFSIIDDEFHIFDFSTALLVEPFDPRLDIKKYKRTFLDDDL